MTNRHPGELVPGKSYQFRINAIKQINNDDRLVDKSPWSETVSFQHISKVAPVITETERLVSFIFVYLIPYFVKLNFFTQVLVFCLIKNISFPLKKKQLIFVG